MGNRTNWIQQKGGSFFVCVFQQKRGSYNIYFRQKEMSYYQLKLTAITQKDQTSTMSSTNVTLGN